MILMLWMCFAMLVQEADTPTAIDENKAPSTSQQTVSSWKRSPKRYCGLYCVFGAAKIYGEQISFKDLLDPSYLSHRSGSTAGNLLEALKDIGLHGQFVKFMPISALRSVQKPVILHVRAAGSAGRYSHWVLYTGELDGKLSLFDPPRDVGEVEPSELLSIWDGTAIIVSENPDHRIVPPASFLLVAIIAILCLLQHISMHRFSPWVSMLLPGIFLAGVFHLAHPLGFSRSRTSLENVMAAYLSPSIERIDIEGVKEKVSNDAILVDARPSDAYELGHLPNAINIPMNSGFLGLRKALFEYPKDNELIFYCQSSRCTWAETVAKQFKVRGYSKISIYEGGVNDWNEQVGKLESE